MNLGGEGEDIRGGKVFLGKRVLSSIDRKWRFLLGTQTDSESLVRWYELRTREGLRWIERKERNRRAEEAGLGWGLRWDRNSVRRRMGGEMSWWRILCVWWNKTIGVHRVTLGYSHTETVWSLDATRSWVEFFWGLTASEETMFWWCWSVWTVEP